MTRGTLLRSEDLGLKPDYCGKVRDLFDLGDKLLIVATDRISAYDQIMHEAVEGKGEMLTQISVKWFKLLEGLVAHHLISDDWQDFPEPFNRPELGKRSMLVHKTDRFDIECVIRGYLTGSGLKDYNASGKVCGIALPEGLRDADKLPEPIFTPATKEDEGHDMNVDHETAAKIVGDKWFEPLANISRRIYEAGEAHARKQGIIIADTKFEFGIYDGKLMLIDEVLTPDSSRFWEAGSWEPGKSPASFDKQILRNWLDEQGWDRESSPPHLPLELRQRIYARYEEILVKLFPGSVEA